MPAVTTRPPSPAYLLSPHTCCSAHLLQPSISRASLCCHPCVAGPVSCCPGHQLFPLSCCTPHTCCPDPPSPRPLPSRLRLVPSLSSAAPLACFPVSPAYPPASHAGPVGPPSPQCEQVKVPSIPAVPPHLLLPSATAPPHMLLAVPRTLAVPLTCRPPHLLPSSPAVTCFVCRSAYVQLAHLLFLLLTLPNPLLQPLACLSSVPPCILNWLLARLPSAALPSPVPAVAAAVHHCCSHCLDICLIRTHFDTAGRGQTGDASHGVGKHRRHGEA